MQWQSAGADGGVFREQAQAKPGWYWVYRPRNVGERAYDPDVGVLLPVFVRADGSLSSPLAELVDLTDESLTCLDAGRGVRWGTFFCGPIQPGEEVGVLRLTGDGRAEGFIPRRLGWWWCRAHAPLMHVDGQGVGPIFLARGRDGRIWVYPASTSDGGALDIWELGFSEPLVTDQGVIDGAGEAGRTEARFFGQIPAPPALPGAFPSLS
ncbi:MAG: hypothetical protein H6739_13395 [Alphaproteobacteria bacterium]|nr:hypothetical protein [Alphaproteobacteria bacterium]